MKNWMNCESSQMTIAAQLMQNEGDHNILKFHLIFLYFWRHLLSSFSQVLRNHLQDPEMNFYEAAAGFDSLKEESI